MSIDYAQQAGMTEYDWLEFVGFTWKVESEGYDYASEHYAPEFESDGLKAVVNNEASLKGLYRKHQPLVEAWQEAVGYKEVDRLWSAHLREEKERGEADLLWALHPGGDWNYAAYSAAFATREEAEMYIAESNRLAEQYANFNRCDWRILHRDAPGGEWNETRLPA